MASSTQMPGKRKEDTGDTTSEEPDPNVTEEGESLQEEIDHLLDEIEETLKEEDSEEFVTNYVQRGGE